MNRFLADIFLFIIALGGYPFLFVPLMVILLFRFDRHYESLVVAIVVDVLYGAPLWPGGGMVYLFGTVAAAAFVVAQILKKRLRYYSKHAI